MRQFSLYLLIFFMFGLIFFQAGNLNIEADSGEDLKTLVSILHDEHILITDWSLYTRETLVNEEVDKVAKRLKPAFPDWTWMETEDEVTAVSRSSSYDEKITIKQQLDDTYVFYEIKGKMWSEEAIYFQDEVWPTRLVDIFRGNETTFSCVKGEFSDNMEKTLPEEMNGLLDAFQAEKIEALAEENFLSTSAYSPKFSGVLSEDHEMNLQLGIRKPNGMGGNTTLVVGTPIITIEY